jgi:hypothetical protein
MLTHECVRSRNVSLMEVLRLTSSPEEVRSQRTPRSIPSPTLQPANSYIYHAQRLTQKTFTTPNNDDFYARFTYTDIPASTKQIRLIKVLRNPIDGTICCEFIPSMTLDKAKRRYYTVSYCAGDPEFTTKIYLNGSSFNVFRSLGLALGSILNFWAARFPDKECLLWIDQICINQSDYRERAHQVGYMKDIYSSAKCTIVSLESASGVTQEAKGLDFLLKLPPLDHNWSDTRFRNIQILRYLWSRIDSTAFLESWLHLYDVLEHPWWSRAWVQQEFICSPDVIFICRDRWISWDILSPDLAPLCSALGDLTIIDAYNESNYLSFNIDPGSLERFRPLPGARKVLRKNLHARDAIKRVELLAKAKTTWQDGGDLKQILTFSQYCKSSDPRDRIFALQGLAHPGYAIIPDYSENNTISRVLLQSACQTLRCDGKLDLLTYAVRTRDRYENHLPSWAPDWISTRYLDDGGFASLPNDGIRRLKRLGPILSFGSKYDDVNATILKTRGYLIDTIEKSLPVFANAPYDAAFLTKRGYTIRSRSQTWVGGQVWILFGAKQLFVLHQCEDGFHKVHQ